MHLPALGLAACLTAMLGLLAGCESVPYERAYEQAPLDRVEVRSLPATRWIRTEAAGGYFQQSDRLFRRLFDFIRDNDVSMTVPVEADLEPAGMRFFLGRDAPADLADKGDVKVVEVPNRRVATLGGRGAYSEANVDKVRRELEAWVVARDRWRVDGEPYAVFWSGPFTPWFLKRFEVHLPVRPAS